MQWHWLRAALSIGWLAIGSGAASATPDPATPAAKPGPASKPAAKPAPAPKLPACVANGSVPTIRGQDGRTILCNVGFNGCIAVHEATPTDAELVRGNDRHLPSTLAELRDDDNGKHVVCLDQSCKPAGKRLLAAIHKEEVDMAGPAIVIATTDLKAVVFGASAWSVVQDRALKLVAPRELKGKQHVSSVDTAGNWLVISWATCSDLAGCAMAVLVDADGHNHGAAFPSGNPVKIDDHRFAVVPTATSPKPIMTMFELASGKQLAQLELTEAAGSEVSAGLIDDHTLAITYNGTPGWIVTWLHVPDGQPPTIGPSTTIPSCKP